MLEALFRCWWKRKSLVAIKLFLSFPLQKALKRLLQFGRCPSVAVQKSSLLKLFFPISLFSVHFEITPPTVALLILFRSLIFSPGARQSARTVQRNKESEAAAFSPLYTLLVSYISNICSLHHALKLCNFQKHSKLCNFY